MDVAAVLRDLPNELVFELNEDEEDDEWTHENRFIRHSKGGITWYLKSCFGEIAGLSLSA